MFGPLEIMLIGFAGVICALILIAIDAQPRRYRRRYPRR